MSRGAARGASRSAVRRGELESRILILVTLALVAFGIVMVYSATSAAAAVGGTDPNYYLVRQGAYALVGIGLLLAAQRWDFRRLRLLAPPLVLVTIALLVAVLVLGTPVNGARRWLTFGPIAFQPSELAKLTIAIWAAAYLSRHRAPQTLGELARPFGLLAGLVAALVVVEPDLGTAIAIVVMLFAILVVAGTPFRVLGAAGGIVALAGIVAIWSEPYRRARFFAFLNPWDDAQGSGFQIVQAMIGMGSGGIFGVGVGEGVQKIFYLPEARSDMMLASIGEEVGLIGVAGIVAAYVLFAFAGMKIAIGCRDPFGKRLAAGLTTLVCGQAAVNCSAVLGIAPLTGIPLPFLSYGGSSLVVLLASVGILLNIAQNGDRAAASVRDRRRGDGRARAPRARSGGRAQGARRARDPRRVAGSRRSAARS